ncbi:glycosyltransferase family 4 protein [Methylococcaceae bacterium WWC4]|nr:glycosyltransferase family 4 protein [Methylococcaceae bacterium WWC4]
MSSAYFDLLGDRFTLHAPGATLAPYHRPMHWFERPWPRYMTACARAAWLAVSDRKRIFLTRDIAIALTVVLLGVRAVYEVHSEPAGKLPAAMFRWLAKRSNFKLVCISRALFDYYGDRFGIPESRRQVAHSGVFPELYLPLRLLGKTALRKKLGLPADRLVIVHSGSLYKGGAELFGELAGAHQQALLIHLGGKTEECEAWAAHYLDRGFSNLRFIPHQPAETVREYQVAADLLFYVSTKKSPIYWCTSPLKLFEYMASGTPVLGCRLGSVSEAFDDSLGFCFDPDDPESIRAGFETFLREPAAAAERAANALAAAEQRYSWHRRAEAILKFADGSF